MKQFLLSLIVVASFFLSGCSGSRSPNNAISIDVVESEALAPARWVFKASETGSHKIVSYRWSFSDDAEGGRVEGSSQSSDVNRIEHTFSEPGTYNVYLNYKTAEGREGTVAKNVVIKGGRILGTITAALDTLVDVDTRDPSEPSGNNDSFANAQVLSASTRLSGLVDQHDPEDYYQLQLQKNQRLTLQVADEGASGYEAIRLALYRASSSQIAESDLVLSVDTASDTGRHPPIIVPSEGRYFIKLIALNPRTLSQGVEAGKLSHGNYSLTIGPPDTSIVGSYALGEVNIMLKPERQFQAQGLSTKMNLGQIKTLALADAQAFLASQNMTVDNRLFIASGTSQDPTEEYDHWQTLQVIAALASHPDILYAEPNWKRYPAALSTIDDPFYASQWHYDTINVPQAWQAMTNRGASNVVVAVLDTGVLTQHPDLKNNVMAGYDFVDNDTDANDPGDKTINGQRSSFHGTHVAGTIAAAAGNSIGGVGIAAGVKVMPVRVLGQDGGFGSDIMKGVCYASGLSTVSNSACDNTVAASAPSDIINLSLGGPGYSNIEQALYNQVTASGIIVIAAAGNESTSEAFYPAAYDKVISVSAVNQNLEQASYSNFGSTVDVAAPGGDFAADSGILSTWGDDRSGSTILTYGALQGTSMAAPHVAGVAALMKSVKPGLTHNEFVAYLNNGDLTQDLGVVGRDDIFGQGLIDAQKAILLMQEAPEPQILSSNNRLFFNVSQSRLEFELTAIGVDSDAELGDVSVQISGADNNSGGRWLQINKTTGLGLYQVSVDRGGLLEGTYQAELKVTSSLASIKALNLSVQLQVGNAKISANAGVQYVVVVDELAEPDAEGNYYSEAGSFPLVARDGKYYYQIDGLKKGRYFVSTGSDLDLDDTICDAGESCGQYPTLEQPKSIVISEEQSQVEANMSVNYLALNSASMEAAPGKKVNTFSIYKYAAKPPALNSVKEMQETKKVKGE